MLKISDLTKSFGSQLLFDNINLQMEPGEKLGVVGRNGHGKTTLFNLILKKELADSGNISLPKNYSIGYLKQHINFTENDIVTETAKGLTKDREDQLWEVEKILTGLGFMAGDLNRHPSEFSGGFQVRINLAKSLVANPDLLLLDEPTNYLDILSIRWLAEFLRRWKGELMLITHDRHFMDNVCTHTMMIHREQVRKIKGPTHKLFGQIKMEEEIHENTRLNEAKKRKQEEVFITRFRAKARMAGMVQSRVKALEKRIQLKKLDNVQDLRFDFSFSKFEAKYMLNVHNLVFSYVSNGPPVVNKITLDIGSKERIAIIGRNGKGKSTLMKLLAKKLEAQSGSYKPHPSLKIGFYEQTNVKQLDPERTVVEEIVSADPDKNMRKARDICGAMMFEGDKALKKIKVLSGGEKSRVCLGKILMQPNHLLLLDEPTNHLDPESCNALLHAMKDFPGSVIIITHNEGFLRSLPNRLVVFQENDQRVFEGNYKDFLSQIGWESEADLKPHNDKISKNKSVNKKDVRRVKAQKIKEKGIALKPLQKKVKVLEKAITENEDQTNEVGILLSTAYAENNGDDITELSIKHHDLKKKNDLLYKDLENAINEKESKEKEFE